VEERREAVEIIRRFVRGEIEEEPLLGFARKLEIESLHQLSETLELRSEDFRRIGFRREDLIRFLEYFLQGRMELDALRRRAKRISQIFSATEYVSASVYRPELAEALNLLTLVLDPRSPLDPACIQRYLIPLHSALLCREAIPFAQAVGQILRDLGEFHFVSLTPLEYSPAGGRLVWADLALLYGRPGHRREGAAPAPENGVHPPAEEGAGDLAPVWFIPLSVATHRFYHEELPGRLGGEDEGDGDGSDGAWMHPRNCRMGRLVKLHPWLKAERWRPLYLIDPRGFAEVVLDLPHLSHKDLAFAVRIFALQNGGAAASLDGKPVELYPSHLPRVF